MKKFQRGLIALLFCMALAVLLPEAVKADGGEAAVYERALARKNQEFNSADAVISGDVPVQEAKDYTLMVYVIGSNLESKLGGASADLAEMEESGLDHEKTNLILYTGGSVRWLSDVPCDKNCVLDLGRDEGERVVASTEKNADMGAYETLAEFVNFCTKYYPAEHYGLIFWDHGGGPLWGYGADELFEGDGLLLSEMKLAMSRTIFSQSQKLDFVGFDACLMGNLETMAVWSEYADYFVASEELEPGDGWDYHFLKVLNKSKDPVKVTTAIVQSFESYYKSNKTQYSNPDVTLSVTKLSEIGAVQTALGNAALVMSKGMETDLGSQITAARANAKSFGITGTDEDGTFFTYDLVDLGSFAEQLRKVCEPEGKELLAALKSFVVKNYSNVDGAGGVTVYYPMGNRSQYNEMREVYEKLGLNREYGDFVKNVGKSWLGGARKNWKLEAPTLDEKAGEYVFTLTPEQAEKTTAVSYSILVRDATGEYWTAMDRLAATPKENGEIRLPRDPKLVILETLGDEMLWPVRIAEDSAKRRVYQTVCTRLLSSGISFLQRPAVCYEDVTVTLQGDPKKTALTVKSIGSLSGEAQGAGKENVDASHYDAIFYYYSPKIPTWDANGEFLPFAEWRQDSENRSGMQTIGNSFGFSLKPASQLSEELYYVVTLEDEGGQLYVTEPLLIDPARKTSISKRQTAQGEMVFEVHRDHAVLISYVGTDESIAISEQVDGVLVTEIAPYAFATSAGSDPLPLKNVIFPSRLRKIGSGAFRGCVSLDDLTFPTSLDSIGSRAFANCIGLTKIKFQDRLRTIGAYAFSGCTGLKRITLPQAANSLGEGLFACCENLEEINLSGSNSHYKIVDGALYSKNGKTLFYVPAKKTGSFEVQKGTKTIASDCFSSSRLSEVILPEGLETIENYAFYGAEGLRVPAFPESLESIGNYAFYAGWNNLNLAGSPEGVQEIRIGKNLTYLGREAFVGFTCRRFTVDEENPSYASKDGALLNKAGDAILEFAANGQNTFVIPDGVKVFDFGLLEQIGQDGHYVENPPYHLYVPDSVFRFTGRTTFLWDVVIHCSPESNAMRYATDAGIEVSDEWDPVLRQVTQDTARGNLTYQLTGKKAILVHYEGTDEELVIPAQVAGRPVTIVGNGKKGLMGALSTKTVKKVVLPDTVETIAAHAFEYFGSFECAWPKNLKVIGDQAFIYCNVPIKALPEGLTELGEEALGSGCDFSDGVTIPSTISWISPGAFKGIRVSEFKLADGNVDYCVKDGMLYSGDGRFLVAGVVKDEGGKVEIPAGTEAIGVYAFSGLPVTEVVIPDSVTVIAQYAFAYCTKLQRLTLGEGVQNIGSYSFVYTGIRQLELPRSCNRVGIAAFFGASSLQSVSGAPETVESFAFAYCEKLSGVQFENGTQEIGDYAFYQTDVRTMHLPESLRSLGDHVFSAENPQIRSTVMIEMTIGRNLTHIGENAFGGLPISKFIVEEGNEAFTVTERFLTDKAGKRLILCPGGVSGKVIIPEGMHEISNYAFYNCEFITELVIPDTVRVVGQNAFCDHSSVMADSGDRMMLHCTEGSAAQTYAMEQNWPYIIDEEP